MSEGTTLEAGVPIATVNHPANRASCYVHYVGIDGSNHFSEYFPTTKDATAFARSLVWNGQASTAHVIKPQISYSRR